jgi:hypothetical protein
MIMGLKEDVRANFYKNLSPEYGAHLMKKIGERDGGEVWDCIHQSPRVPFDCYAMNVFLRCVCASMRDELFMTQVVVGESPCRDVDYIENQKLLCNLPDGFKADVWESSSGNEQDGRLYVPDDISVGGRRLHETMPLEIGSTDAFTTWFHLIRNGCVARWPYNHKEITLINRSVIGWDF